MFKPASTCIKNPERNRPLRYFVADQYWSVGGTSIILAVNLPNKDFVKLLEPEV